jgi:hypothetical protein
MQTAMLHRANGFDVAFSGLEDATPYDLLLTRDRVEAEVACNVVTAEEGRGVHRGAWFRLADRIDPDLQTWLAAHPGRYLLKMTLPQGLRGSLHGPESDGETLSWLHQRIRSLLETRTRQDYDEAIVLRLDPLLLAGVHAEEMGLVSSLRREFGPEAHLSVTTAGDAVFVMAARAGQENEVAIAIRRRLAELAPTRLSHERPGILSIFVEDTDRLEWRGLRDRLELEGEARQFMTYPEARPVVAISFVSRFELFGVAAPDLPHCRQPLCRQCDRSGNTENQLAHSYASAGRDIAILTWRMPGLSVCYEVSMFTAEYCRKLDELDRLLNDPDVPMEPDRIWSLLADVAHPELTQANRISAAAASKP